MLSLDLLVIGHSAQRRAPSPAVCRIAAPMPAHGANAGRTGHPTVYRPSPPRPDYFTASVPFMPACSWPGTVQTKEYLPGLRSTDSSFEAAPP